MSRILFFLIFSIKLYFLKCIVFIIAQLVNVDTYSVQCWVLLSLYYFYGTGHQAALSSIQWGAAFIGTGGHFTYNAIPAILIIVNTFGNNILIEIS